MLNGGECKGKQSITTMKELGWKLSDSKIMKFVDEYNHIYIFSKESKVKPQLTRKKDRLHKLKINLSSKRLKIFDVTDNSAVIKAGNLKIGQSGIIINEYSKNGSIIIALATVTQTNSQSSTITILEKQVLKQDAIPTIKLKPQNGDIFVLNHLYNVGLLIVPNQQTRNFVKQIHKRQNFIDEDFFASHLKLIEEPVPSKKIIQDFCMSQQIGTIFLAINSSLYIVDAISFEVLFKHRLNNPDKTTQVPFYSKIKEIEKGFFDFGADNIDDYNEYYQSLLGIK
jgi:hypothetical protein